MKLDEHEGSWLRLTESATLAGWQEAIVGERTINATFLGVSHTFGARPAASALSK